MGKLKHKLLLVQLCQPQQSEIGCLIFGQVINSKGKIEDFGHKQGKGFGEQAAHPHPIFFGVPPSPFTASTRNFFFIFLCPVW